MSVEPLKNGGAEWSRARVALLSDVDRPSCCVPSLKKRLSTAVEIDSRSTGGF
jgi:hypothetical protein